MSVIATDFYDFEIDLKKSMITFQITISGWILGSRIIASRSCILWYEVEVYGHSNCALCLISRDNIKWIENDFAYSTYIPIHAIETKASPLSPYIDICAHMYKPIHSFICLLSEHKNWIVMEKEVQITVKWSGEEYPITDIGENDTVLSLKEKIHKMTGVRPERQKLLNLKFKGYILLLHKHHNNYLISFLNFIVASVNSLVNCTEELAICLLFNFVIRRTNEFLFRYRQNLLFSERSPHLLYNKTF